MCKLWTHQPADSVPVYPKLFILLICLKFKYLFKSNKTVFVWICLIFFLSKHSGSATWRLSAKNISKQFANFSFFRFCWSPYWSFSLLPSPVLCQVARDLPVRQRRPRSSNGPEVAASAVRQRRRSRQGQSWRRSSTSAGTWRAPGEPKWPESRSSARRRTKPGFRTTAWGRRNGGGTPRIRELSPRPSSTTGRHEPYRPFVTIHSASACGGFDSILHRLKLGIACICLSSPVSIARRSFM